MTEQFRLLAREAGIKMAHSETLALGHLDTAHKKFAELIAKECARLCSLAAEENARTVYALSQTQEMAPTLVAKGGQLQAEKLAKQIKLHFGVEE